MLSCLVMLYSSSSAQVKNHAVVIGIDHYKYADVWISNQQVKDNVDSVLYHFRNNAIRSFEVHELRNENATLNRIDNEFKSLKVKEGDNIVVYLAGHGSQCKDVNNDELDQLDEVFVCYDSPATGSDGFIAKSLIDDHIDDLLTDLRIRLGKKGQVFFIVESCHSGTINKGGVNIDYRTDSKTWQTAFMSEKPKAHGDVAPLICFSSSRAYAQTVVDYQYTLCFLAQFVKFNKGSYYDLFQKFYLFQQREKLAYGDIVLTPNVSVEDPFYLRLGVLQDTVYDEITSVRVIAMPYEYPKDPTYTIDKGIYQGLTVGSRIKLTDPETAKTHTGTVSFVKSSSAVVTPPCKETTPDENSLWRSRVEITDYNFQDTLFVAIDRAMPKEMVELASAAIKKLVFVKNAVNNDKGYTLLFVAETGFIIKRNSDNKGLYLVKNKEEVSIQSALLKMQINHFIMQLSMSVDSSLELMLMKETARLPDDKLNILTSGQKYSVYVHPLSPKGPRYYCLLQIEDEFIKQLVPVNFQVNESECRISAGATGNIYIGDIAVGGLDGRLLLIGSDAPIDLREILLAPMDTRKKGKDDLRNIARLVSQLLLNRNGNQTLYKAEDIYARQLIYHVQK